MVPRVRKLRLDEVTFAMVDAWRLELPQTLKPATVSRLRTDFRRLLGYAHKRDALERLPWWQTQRVGMPTPTFLTFEETSRPIAAAEPMDANEEVSDRGERQAPGGSRCERRRPRDRYDGSSFTLCCRDAVQR